MPLHQLRVPGFTLDRHHGNDDDRSQRAKSFCPGRVAGRTGGFEGGPLPAQGGGAPAGGQQIKAAIR